MSDRKIKYTEDQQLGFCFFVKEVPAKNNINRRAIFECGCGNQFESVISHVKAGRVYSCGCYNVDKNKRLNATHGHNRVGKRTSEYEIWKSMKKRCYNKNCKSYPNYGGRGISVCNSWFKSFENFLNDMGSRPTPIHSIDRIDSNGNYTPENCRWATPIEQGRNTRKNVNITHNGETKCLSEWEEITGIGRKSISKRLFKNGWSVERALTTPIHRGANQYTYSKD